MTASPGSLAVESDERTRLLQLLMQDGILHASEDQPVLSGDGTPARWMLDSLCVSLGSQGAHLAGGCLLRLLEDFEGCQLATYGLTGVPLLQACVLRGEGRYRGLLVRKERKPHGSLKLIEGKFDPAEPVVIVDDSVSSGRAMLACADQLEAAGFQVEGGICLVRFDYERGISRMIERGYRMASVFDIREDFMRHMDGEAPVPTNPTKAFPALPPSPRVAPDGLHPADLARQAIAEFLRTGLALQPPRRLDRDYDTAGGCWVSVRRKADVYDRLARSGFWHFPGEPGSSTPAGDVVLAAVANARDFGLPREQALAALDESALAVTFFSALEECTVGELDNDRYGIVVRSRERPGRMGGGLPRMPGIVDEWQQFAHAHRNARVLPHEPYRLYRHGVEKVVEPGASWQPTGIPLAAPADDGPDGGCLARHAHASVLHALGRGPEPATTAEESAAWRLPSGALAFVTVYAGGRIAGCTGGPLEEPAAAVAEYATAAIRDARFEPPADDDPIATSVAVLHNRLVMGRADPDWVVRPTKFGRQALEVRQGDRHGLLLPSVAVTANLTPRGYVDEVIDKAGITRPPYHWTRYDCDAWLADGGGARRLRHGLPEGQPAATAAEEAERLRPLLVDYSRRHHVRPGDGPTTGRYEVFADRLRSGLATARLAYGAWVRARAGLTAEAEDDIRRLEESRDASDGWIRLGSDPPSISELAFLLLTQAELGRPDPSVARHLWAQVDVHGRFATHADPAADVDAWQDYAPGQALLALASVPPAETDTAALHRALRFYRMRFRQHRHWGSVAWLTQAYAAWGETAFAYEIADWALQFQSAKSGAFLNDHQADSPGATTALYLEGLAAVWRAAVREGADERAQRYRDACDQALMFLDQLVYQDRDAPVLPNPTWAIGGVRTSLTASDVRIDYVHHALAAVLTLQ